MRKYYYSVGEDRVGPVTLGELKLVSGLSPETLMWYDGLSTWLRASDIAELSDVFAPAQPVAGQSMFNNPFSFDGRIHRQEYVISSIIAFMIIMCSNWLITRGGVVFALGLVLLVPLLWFNLAQGCKRSHDIGLSGWMQLIPLYSLYLLFAKGNKGANEYGPVPERVYAPSVPPNPFSFAGRISRLEYVISALMSPCAVMLSFIPERSGTWISLVLFIAFYTLLCWFNFGQGCKRCHDIGRSGWMQLIPLYSLYLLFAQGNKGANKYGPDPESV
jgi:uncharacterized membrane protein YhaH (DUF805 family)